MQRQTPTPSWVSQQQQRDKERERELYQQQKLEAEEKQRRYWQEMQERRAHQWMFTDEEVLSTPSVLDGLLPVEERLRRAKGVSFIMQAGAILELPPVTLWAASVFFHRFYMRRSMVPEKPGGIHHYVRLPQERGYGRALVFA